MKHTTDPFPTATRSLTLAAAACLLGLALTSNTPAQEPAAPSGESSAFESRTAPRTPQSSGAIASAGAVVKETLQTGAGRLFNRLIDRLDDRIAGSLGAGVAAGDDRETGLTTEAEAPSDEESQSLEVESTEEGPEADGVENTDSNPVAAPESEPASSEDATAAPETSKGSPASSDARPSVLPANRPAAGIAGTRPGSRTTRRPAVSQAPSVRRSPSAKPSQRQGVKPSKILKGKKQKSKPAKRPTVLKAARNGKHPAPNSKSTPPRRQRPEEPDQP